ncbi:hypothetical protein A4E84_10025 [Streptomyces qaidamensis]|uniref:Uncharacterized protein n=1 Tax=Streptomyces qaidamensis TaxID=1783515 RepID=A0A143BYB6_9ACTN|nr:hypothetical protein A4E84_10025 [Streptomyces qaidamensis]
MSCRRTVIDRPTAPGGAVCTPGRGGLRVGNAHRDEIGARTEARRNAHRGEIGARTEARENAHRDEIGARTVIDRL